MPTEEKASLPEPMRLPQRRSNRLVPALFLAVVLGGIAATVLLVNDARNLKRLMTRFGLENLLLKPAPEPVKVGRPQHALPASRYPAWLLKAEFIHPSALKRASSETAEDRCRALDPDAKASEWSFTPADDGSWECLYFHQYDASSEAASLFVQMRGDDPQKFRTLRMKLSLTNTRDQRAILDLAAEFTRALMTPMSSPTETYLIDHLKRLRSFKSEMEDYRVTFESERQDTRRYNLIVIALDERSACPQPQDKPPEPRQVPVLGMRIGCLAIRHSPFDPASRQG